MNHTRAGNSNGPVAAPPDEEVRAVVFTDVVESTRVLEQIGDRSWYRIITWHHKQAQRLGAAFAAESMSSTGDGVLVLFADPADAVGFALEMTRRMDGADFPGVDESPRLHVGVAIGPVLRWKSDYFGRTIHLAARLSDAAAAGEVLVSEGCAMCLAREEIAAEERLISLRGFAAPERVYSARQPSTVSAVAAS